MRFISYALAGIIVMGATLCGWIVAESRKPGVSGEILMVTPAASVTMFVCGLALMAWLYAKRRELSNIELALLGTVAAIGTLLLPMLILIDF